MVRSKSFYRQLHQNIKLAGVVCAEVTVRKSTS